jgi:hypothetical protein
MARQENQFHIANPAMNQCIGWRAPWRVDDFFPPVFQTVNFVKAGAANDAEGPFAHLVVLKSLRMPMGGGERGLGVVSSTSSAST